MSKPIIAIDCDDTIINTASNFLDYYNNTFGTNVELKDYYSSDLSLWKADRETFDARVHSYLNSADYQNITPFDDAINVIDQLSDKFELHIVTARPDSLVDITKSMLQLHFPDKFNSIIFTNDLSSKKRTKAEVCNELSASYLIDDHIHHAEIAAEHGISVLLFGDYPWNETSNLHANIQRVQNWHQIQDILLKSTTN